jgi:hypothetical protein
LNEFKVDEHKSFLEDLDHVYVISLNNQKFQDLSFREIESSCCVLVPDSCDIISDSSLSDLQLLETLNILASIKELSEECFYECTAVKEIISDSSFVSKV